MPSPKHRRTARRQPGRKGNCKAHVEVQQLEARTLLSHLGPDQVPLPSKVGETFVIDDFNNKVTRSDLGSNYFGGNTGAVESATGITTLSWLPDSAGSAAGSLRVSFDFTNRPADAFAGYFSSLFGLTATKVSLDGSGREPANPTPFPDYFLDTRNLYRDLSPLANRSIEQLRFDTRLTSANDVTLKIELKDENGFDVFTRRVLSGNAWQTMALSLPGDFTDSVVGRGDTRLFDWRRVSLLSFIVERVNVGAGVVNPVTGTFLVDNLQVVDTNGSYPDLAAAQHPATGELLPQYTAAFLDHVRATSFLYFLDFASTDPRTGGIVQDSSTFADLMSVGGAGFQLTSYVVGSERGYISRDNAAARARNVLRALHDGPQGPGRVGTTGHKGFFYHFLGIDGRRKLNFNFNDTPQDESKNTVELSTIDTALVVAGALTAGQYFNRNTPVEAEIRSLADAIYRRVEWPFMLNAQRNQFYLGWKPLEMREGPAFEVPDGNNQGHYSGTPANPQTLDFYTDEAVLVALLAIASPTHPVPANVFFATERAGEPFVKTLPGSLFTYQFGSVWLDTRALGTDAHPTRPINYFDNTTSAILATRQYAIDNPNNRATWRDGRGAKRWGLSATEGPFDDYFAEAAPTAAIATAGECIGSGPRFALEAEAGAGAGPVMPRGAASGQRTVWLHAGETRTLTFSLSGTALYEFVVRYSNDGFSDLVQVSIDGTTVGQFLTRDTRPPGGVPGSGWNEFFSSGPIGSLVLAPGPHTVTVRALQSDLFGVEIDVVHLTPKPVTRPLEVGTVTVHAVGSSVVHTPAEAVAALWESQRLGLLHSRFGYADAFNKDIADAAIPGCVDLSEPRLLRAAGRWANFTGFAIDHGPMLVLIDNYLEHQFVPRLFMSYPPVREALRILFPNWVPPGFSPPADTGSEGGGTVTVTVPHVGAIAGTVTIPIAAGDGTAIAGLAYYAATAAHASNTAFVAGLYADGLGRATDVAGQAYRAQALDSWTSRVAVAHNFLTATERYSRVLDAHYGHFFDHLADPTGKTYLLNLLENGRASLTLDGMGIIGLAEYFARP